MKKGQTNTRILGLDIGDKRIGVALSDPQGLLASPLTVVDRKGEESDLEAILTLVQQWGAERVVVGLPLSLDGSIGRQAQKVLAFIHRLSGYIKVPVEPWDERFTTVAAERMMLEASLKRKVRKARRDTLSAALILQGYLDRMRGSPSMDEEI